MIDMTNATPAEKVAALILRGRCDGEFETIYEALQTRHRVLARKAFAALQVGDMVRVSNNIKPKYMAGSIGRVVEKRQSKVEVEFDEPMGRFGRRVICPASAIEKIS